jgi:hypothetical protein
MTPNIDSIIRDHVTLTVRCLDRIYLQGYMPKLQTSGGLCYFLRDHLGHPIPSPALFRPMLDRFVNVVKAYAAEPALPLIPFEPGQDKDAIVAGYRAKFTALEGLVIVGVAQEKMRSFKAHKRCGPGTAVTFDFTRQPVSVNHYYFYLHDSAWGPAFIKIGTYLPYPIKICLNGHEWVKQQLRRAQVPFTSLDNGFLSCADPVRLQTICDQLGPRDIQQFFDRWSHRLPWPMRPEDRAAGFDHRITLCQLEISLTQIFDRPVHGRHFFEAVIRENLDLGRPDRVRLLFPRRLTRRTPPPAYGYRTRIITDGVEPSLHIEYKHSHQAVLQRRARSAERAHDQQSQRLRLHQGTRPVARLTRAGRYRHSHAPDRRARQSPLHVNDRCIGSVTAPASSRGRSDFRAAVWRPARPSAVSSVGRLCSSPRRLSTSRSAPAR